MKKIVALVLALLMLSCCFASCGKGEDTKYIEKKGTLVIGITYYEPMNYKDSNGNLVGFETEFAQAVCEILGVEAKFQEINWGTKEMELNGKTIDCIWNGMTITSERQENMSISTPYMKNRQVLITKAENLAKYSTDPNSLKDAKVVAEIESAGEEVAKTNPIFAQAKYTAVDSMKDAIMEVSAGTADVCIVDYVTSIGMIGEGSSYAGLSMDEDFVFADEQYGIALRKGSDYTEQINKAIKKLIDNGKLEEIAKKYKLDAILIK